MEDRYRHLKKNLSSSDAKKGTVTVSAVGESNPTERSPLIGAFNRLATSGITVGKLSGF